MSLDQNPDPEEVARGEANAAELKLKLQMVGEAVGRIFGPGIPWVLAVVPSSRTGTLTIGNMDVPGQVAILRSVMHTFDADKSVELVNHSFVIPRPEQG